MKKIRAFFKWLVIGLFALAMLILLPIGINKLYTGIRSTFLTDSEKRLEDIDRLEFLFENEFAGYGVLPGTADFDTQIRLIRQGITDGSIDSDSTFELAILKAVASFRDPHTTVIKSSMKGWGDRFPYYLTWSEGHFYLVAGQVKAKWLGAKVTKFDNTPGQEVFEKLSAYTNAPNEAGSAFFMGGFAYAPQVLLQEGIISDPNRIRLEVTNGQESEVLSFQLVAREQVAALADYRTMDDGTRETQIPLFKKRQEENYWFTYLEGENIVYLRYRACIDQGEVNGFWNTLFDQIKDRKPEKLIIDIRGNAGGDTRTHRYFLNLLKKDTLINRYGRLFTLIDRGTGSAAVSLASELEMLPNSLLVGESTMDAPNTTSDPTYFTLPHSKLTLLIPNLYSLHSYIADKRNAVNPDIRIFQEISSKAKGSDKVLDSIISLPAIDVAPEYAALPERLAGQYHFSPIRNASLERQDSIWYVSIDGLTKSPLYQGDSTWYTRNYEIEIFPSDHAREHLLVRVHASPMELPRIAQADISLVHALDERNFELADSLVRNLQENGKLPYYLDRSFFLSRTYDLFHSRGLEEALRLNALTKKYLPEDPVLSIVDFELNGYGGETSGQVRAIFPALGKLLKRYYRIITTDRVMNDDYNAFIGK